MIASVLLNGNGVCMFMQASTSVLETIHSILSAVAVLTTDRRSDTSSLPEVLRKSLPLHVAEFLMSLSLVTFSVVSNFQL